MVSYVIFLLSGRKIVAVQYVILSGTMYVMRDLGAKFPIWSSITRDEDCLGESVIRI